MDLMEIAARLDADEKLKLTYRLPVRSADGKVAYETHVGDLLDVAEDSGLYYVSHEDEIIWVKQEEVVEIAADGTK